MKEFLKKIMLKIPILIRDFLLKEIKEEIKTDIKEINKEVKEIKKDNKAIHSELLKNSLDTMKIAICSEELPLSERVSIGKEYIDKGGNGAIKIKVHVLEDEYEKELKNNA